MKGPKMVAIRTKNIPRRSRTAVATVRVLPVKNMTNEKPIRPMTARMKVLAKGITSNASGDWISVS